MVEYKIEIECLDEDGRDWTKVDFKSDKPTLREVEEDCKAFYINRWRGLGVVIWNIRILGVKG